MVEPEGESREAREMTNKVNILGISFIFGFWVEAFGNNALKRHFEKEAFGREVLGNRALGGNILRSKPLGGRVK